MSSSKPSPSGEGGPAGPDEASPPQLPVNGLQRFTPPSSVRFADSCPRGGSQIRLHLAHILPEPLGHMAHLAFSSRRCSMVNALKNRFHIRCQSSSVSSVPGI